MSNASFYFAVFLFSYEAFYLLNNELSSTIYALIKKVTEDDKLTAQIMHDIRSPTTVLKILLKQINWDESKRDIKDAVLDSVEQINSISKTALKGYRKTIFSNENITTVNLIREVVNKNQVYGENITWDLSIHPSLSEASIRIDKLVFARILQNLISNAREAVGVSKISISALKQAENILIYIENDGELIPVDALDLILKAGGSYNKEKGTGLGVQYCIKEIRRIGGVFKLRSEDGKTIASLKIPV